MYSSVIINTVLYKTVRQKKTLSVRVTHHICQNVMVPVPIFFKLDDLQDKNQGLLAEIN